MDSEAIRKKRQEDMEAKRKRLEEMRRSRQEAAAQQTAAPSPPPVPVPKVEKEEIDEIQKLTEQVTAPQPEPELSPKQQTPAVVVSKEDLLREKINSFVTVKSFNIIDILPTKAVSYDKSSQVEEEDMLFLKDEGDHYEAEMSMEQDIEDENDQDEDATSSSPVKGLKSPSPTKVLFSNSKKHQLSGRFSVDAEAEARFNEKAKTVLSEEERSKITGGPGFQNFLRTSSLYVERALALTEEHDVIRDFTVDDKGAGGDLDEHSAFVLPSSSAGTSSSGGANTSTISTFEEDHLAGRPVMDLQWSHLVPELFLAAYGARSTQSAPGKPAPGRSSAGGEEEAPGVVCVWSKDLHTRPEFRFTASSPVLAAAFHSHEQHSVLGGCYSGQILLWDMKLNKALPVQRSSMSGKGHKHPVYAMAMTSSAVAAELVSVSTDGLLCQWDVSRLTEPVTVVQLHLPSHSANPSLHIGGFLSPLRDSSNIGSSGSNSTTLANPLNISAMAFGHSAADHSSGSAGDVVGAADLLFGCGSGQLVRTPLPYKDNHPGAVKVDAHFGFITAIEPHPSRSNKYKHLLLSSSLDWTVKLWDLKDFSQPLFEFFTPSYDYVCDVQWSPIHPAVFITVTSGGKISLWNLSRSSTEPVDVVNLTSDMDDLIAGLSGTAVFGRSAEAAGGQHAGATRALNKVVWARDGLSVLCGDSQGALHMLRLHAGAVQPTAQDESRFEVAITSKVVEHQQAAAEESKLSSSVNITPKKRSEVGGDEGFYEDGLKPSGSDSNFAMEFE